MLVIVQTRKFAGLTVRCKLQVLLTHLANYKVYIFEAGPWDKCQSKI